MINNVSMTGRLTRDLELKYTQSGTAVGTFNLAVDRQFTNAQGQRETDFVNCVIWRKSAENLANFTRKGSLIGVTGRIQTRTYDNNAGQRVYVTEVVVENFALLESKATTQARPQETPQTPQQAQSTGFGQSFQQSVATAQTPANGVNQAPQANMADPFVGNGQPVDIKDDDLPF